MIQSLRHGPISCIRFGDVFENILYAVHKSERSTEIATASLSIVSRSSVLAEIKTTCDDMIRLLCIFFTFQEKGNNMREFHSFLGAHMAALII